MKPTVIVLDGEQRAALAAVRSLGARGCTVHVGSSTPKSLAGGSRFAASETILPDPLAGTEAYCTAVVRLVEVREATVLLPVTEASTLALLEQESRFSRTSIPTGRLAHFRRASDKAAVLALASELEIDVPRQWLVPAGERSAPAIAVEEFPVVVKPSRSVTGREGHRQKANVDYAESPAQLQRVIARLAGDSDALLVQRRIQGPGLGVFLLRWQGQIVASFAHRRIREKPPSGGVSVCCESVRLPPELLAQSVRLLDALDWNGLAMVEYKQEASTGRNYLMEINPRPWGSLQLAIDAGVDFPWYLVQQAMGQSTPAVSDWRVGIRSRWCLGDVDHLITRLRHSRADLHLPADAPGLVSTACAVLTPWRPGQRNDVFRASDPVPFFREALAWLRAL